MEFYVDDSTPLGEPGDRRKPGQPGNRVDELVELVVPERRAQPDRRRLRQRQSRLQRDAGAARRGDPREHDAEHLAARRPARCGATSRSPRARPRRVVQFFAGATPIGSTVAVQNGTASVPWSTWSLPDGPVALTAANCDASGCNPTDRSASVVVNVDNMPTITAPASSPPPVSGDVTITATAATPAVQFYRDGVAFFPPVTVTGGTASVTWPTWSLADSHVVVVDRRRMRRARRLRRNEVGCRCVDRRQHSAHVHRADRRRDRLRDRHADRDDQRAEGAVLQGHRALRRAGRSRLPAARQCSGRRSVRSTATTRGPWPSATRAANAAPRSPR